MKNIKSGIYRITNPNNQVYIGQTINLRRRLTEYMTLCKTISGQGRIFNSLKLHTPRDHNYEIIEECSVYELDIQEAYHKLEYIKGNGWDNALFSRIHDSPTPYRKRVEQDFYIKHGRSKHKQKATMLDEFMRGNGEAFINNNGHSLSNLQFPFERAKLMER